MALMCAVGSILNLILGEQILAVALFVGGLVCSATDEILEAIG